MDLTLLVTLVSALSAPLPHPAPRSCACPRAAPTIVARAAVPAVAVPSAAAVSSGDPPVRVAINTATPDELQTLPGVGPRKAERILAARSTRPFRRPSDLRRVPGFGPKTIVRLAPLLSFTEGG